MNSDQIWSIVGKALALIGGVVGVIKIVESITSPRGKLLATVQRVPFVQPDAPLKEPPSYLNVTPQQINDVKRYLIDDDFRFMWIVSIRNLGKKPCDQVKLLLPDAELACISREGKTQEYRKLVHGVISLDTLGPAEVIELFAWADSSWISIDKVRLSHSSGMGKVLIKLPASRFFSDFEDYLRLGKLPLTFFLGACLAGLVVGRFLVSRLDRPKDGPHQQVQITNTGLSSNSPPNNPGAIGGLTN